MIVSAYLHQLLTDTSRGDPLKRLFNGFDFHSLNRDLSGSEEKYLMRVDTIIQSTSKFNEVFNLDTRTIPLDSWLEQVVYIQTYQDKGYPITIKKLITEPRHQGGGVHFDPKVYRDFHLVEGMFSFFIGDKKPTYKDYLVIIGEYIHTRVTYELMGALGNGYRSQGLFEKAEEFLVTALQNAKTAGDLHSQCIQLQNLGYLYSQKEKPALAMQQYEEAKQVNEMLGDLETKQSILHNLAATWIKIGNQNFITDGEDRTSALQAYETAYEYARTGQDYQNYIAALVNLGNFHLQQSNSLKAVLAVTKSLLAFWQLDEEEKQIVEMRKAFTRGSKILYTLYRQEQNFEKILIEALKIIDGEDSSDQLSTEEQIETVKKDILDYLDQLAREFPEK